MERARLAFEDRAHPALSGALSVEDDGRVFLTASQSLGKALDASVAVPGTELGPIHFDDARRGLALAAALVKGVPAKLLECESVSGSFELRAYVARGRVRLTLDPGDFDPDAAWEFGLAMNEAKLQAPRA